MSDSLDRLRSALANRYRLERQLGEGGMATVYLAEDLKHHRKVAVKVLRPDLAAVLGPERFLNEIRITAALDHPHIVTLIDSGTDDGLVWYVLPYIRGESLRARLVRERQLGVDEALAITRQIAGALDFAHGHGVIHRDVKPENVLLHEGEAMLADFGIALAARDAGGTRLTESGHSLGTPQYMSPEQATGERHLDARSDVYSLAAVLYEMLAGEPPHTGATPQVVIAKLMTERPMALRVVRDTVPEAVEAAVTRALAKVPADRFASAGEFARSLTAGGAIRARRRPGLRWLAGVAIIATGAALWIALPRDRGASPPFTPQLEQLTTDGNARSPALSPDGTRLAYVARDCSGGPRCLERLVVGDTGGAGTLTLLTGLSIEVLGWAADGRFVLVNMSDSTGPRRAMAVPALGGPARAMHGLAAFAVAATDTVLVSPGYMSTTDSITWLRFVTVSDGRVRDSFAIRAPGLGHFGIPAPVGGRIALITRGLNGIIIRLVDRAGRVTDSVPAIPQSISALSWTPGAGALVWQSNPGGSSAVFGGPGAPAPAVVVRRRVSTDGRFAGPTDTLLRLDRGRQLARLSTDGTVLLTEGPVETVVMALERNRPGRLEFSARRLAASTAGLQALISRDGATVWLKRPGAGPETPRRDAFVPFEGGSERPFDIPAGSEVNFDWTRPASSSLLYAVRTGGGPARLFEIDVATGQSRVIADLPFSASAFFSIPGGGYAAVDFGSHSTRLIGRPGRPDTTWSVPAVAGRILTIVGDAAADGRSLLEFSQSTNFDTVWVRFLPLSGGPGPAAVSTLAAATACFLSDGNVEYVRAEPSGGYGWYHVPPGGSLPVRLGDAPIQNPGSTWSNSEDCRRFIVVEPVDRPDVYLIRNSAELWRR